MCRSVLSNPPKAGSLSARLIRENARKSAAYKVPYILPSGYPMRIVVLSEHRESKDLIFYNLPYILQSSVCSNPFVFTLFTKLPGCTPFLPILERAAHLEVTPSAIRLFSTTYNRSNLQPLCFDNLATVPGGCMGPPSAKRKRRGRAPKLRLRGGLWGSF